MPANKRKKGKGRDVAVFTTTGMIDRPLRLFSTVAQAERWVSRQERRNERNFTYRNYYIEVSPRAAAEHDKRLARLQARLNDTSRGHVDVTKLQERWGHIDRNYPQYKRGDLPPPEPVKPKQRPAVPDFTEVL